MDTANIQNAIIIYDMKCTWTNISAFGRGDFIHLKRKHFESDAAQRSASPP